MTQMLDVTFRGASLAAGDSDGRGRDRHGRLYRGKSRDLYAAPVLHHQRYRPGWAYGNKYNVTVMLSADTTEPSEAETGE